MSDLLQELLSGSRLPEGLDQEDRVRLVMEVMQDLMTDRMPQRAPRIFVASAFQSWLAHGRTGNLESRFLRISPRRGSHRTAQMLARVIGDERQPPGSAR